MTSMNVNEVKLVGTVATTPETHTFPSGVSKVRVLVTVKTDSGLRRRVDVVPVTLWGPSPQFEETEQLNRGAEVLVLGSVQRRFWSEGHHRSQLEVIESHIFQLD